MAVKRWAVFMAVSLAPILLAACTGQALRPVPSDTSTAASDEAVKKMFAPWTETLPAYRIGEGDKLRVMFTRTPEMDEDVLVRPDGMITLKAAGDVAVADLPPADAAQLVAQKATLRLRDPQVTVAVTDPISARIYIGGEVKAPGVFRIAGPMTAVEALQLASGFAATGKIDEVILIRRGPDNRPMLRLVDVRGLLEGLPTENPRIVQGDILFVPRTHIAELGLWVELFIEHVVPFQRNFNYTIGRTFATTNSSGF